MDIFTLVFIGTFLVTALWVAMLFVMFGEMKARAVKPRHTRAAKRVPPLTIVLLSDGDVAQFTKQLHSIKRATKGLKSVQLIIATSRRNRQKMLQKCESQLSKLGITHLAAYGYSGAMQSSESCMRAYQKYTRYKSGFVIALMPHQTLCSQKRFMKDILLDMKRRKQASLSITKAPRLEFGFIAIINWLLFHQSELRRLLSAEHSSDAQGSLEFAVLYSTQHFIKPKQLGAGAGRRLVIDPRQLKIIQNISTRKLGSDLHIQQKHAFSAKVKYTTSVKPRVERLLLFLFITGLFISYVWSLKLAFSLTSFQPIQLLGVTTLLWILIIVWSIQSSTNVINKVVLTISSPALTLFIIVAAGGYVFAKIIDRVNATANRVYDFHSSVLTMLTLK